MPTALCGFNDSPTVPGRDQLVVHGPTVMVRIGFDEKHDTTATTNILVPNIPDALLPALVDTGALESCIDSALAMTLNLPVVDRRIVSGSSGQHEVNMHLAQLVIPSLNYVIHGMFAGVDLAAGGQSHRALIGRTFLRNFTMHYDGRTGTVSLSNDPPQKGKLRIS
jgi:predicted aspartyl protease